MKHSKNIKIAHIINPVSMQKTSDLYIAQPITFETMRRAQNVARKDGLLVELLCAYYEEDQAMKPEGFTTAGILKRSVLDFGKFDLQRNLPLIKDILDSLYDSSNADYFIYTNVDIALNDNFYKEVKRIIDRGYDSFVINRRTLSKKYISIDEIDQMQLDQGKSHPGFDCFIYRRDVYPKYDLRDVCVGANWIGRALIINLIVNADKFKVFDSEHLTFHIGDDRSWNVEKYKDYHYHNLQNILSILRNIDKPGQLDKSELLVQIKNEFNYEEYKHKLAHPLSFKNIKRKIEEIRRLPKTWKG
jgi:hypothetical protein